MRVESAVTSITWIPSEAISGMPKMPFEMGISHYDDPPPDRIDDLDPLHENDLFREANELKAWIEVEDDQIVGHGYSGQGRIGVTRLKLGPREVHFAAVQYPLLQAEPEVGDGWVKFVQSAGGHMGLPAPRRVSGKPFFRIKSASAWTTLQLIVYADGSSKHSLLGASPFPRHWIYDKDGVLVEKSGTIDFERWYRESHGPNTPWGEEDSPTLVTAVESELERDLSASIMRSGAKLERRNLDSGEALVHEGEEGRELFLLLDGMVDVEVNGDVVAEIGPGALLGERALLEGGKRTATIWASTPVRVAVIPPEAIDESVLPELAAGRKREQS
jgi:cyclic nucleotide-binding protein